MNNLPSDFPTGIYFGWAKLGDGPVHRMVVSVGWNPFYQDEKKTMVSHQNWGQFFSHNLSKIVLLSRKPMSFTNMRLTSMDSG